LTLLRACLSVIAEHATPVGYGTVVRSKRIPIEQLAEAEIIAWMRLRRPGMTEWFFKLGVCRALILAYLQPQHLPKGIDYASMFR
jgi:hypothetical protein